MNRTTNIHLIKEGLLFTWGEVVELFSIGEYDIAKYHPWKTFVGIPDQQLCYHGWVNGKDTRETWGSLDAAISGCIAYKHEGINHRADVYFMRAITKTEKRNEKKTDNF